VPTIKNRELLPPEQCDDQPLIDFLNNVHAVESPRLATGSKGTLSDYRTQVAHLQRYFDKCCRDAGLEPRPVQLSDVTDNLVAGAMLQSMARGNSKPTANKIHRSILAIHNHAIARGFPARPLRVKKLHEPRRTPEAWLLPEIEKLLLAARQLPGPIPNSPVSMGEFFYALLCFLLNTGSRIDAAMRTPTSGLDLVRGYITIPADVQKHRNDESFELLPQTAEALRVLRVKERGLPCIFDDWPYDRTRRNYRSLTKRLKQIVLAAGLARESDDLRLKCFHRWRKSFASFVASSRGISVASHMLGHSCLSVTQAYMDPRITNERKVTDALPAITVNLLHGDGDAQLAKLKTITEALQRVEREFGVKLALATG
jgi:integrase